jgi:hypothetical protein
MNLGFSPDEGLGVNVVGFDLRSELFDGGEGPALQRRKGPDTRRMDYPSGALARVGFA